MPVSKINRLIFICVTKFSKRDYQRFGCDIINKRGYEVEVWLCHPWYNPEYSLKQKLKDPFDFSGLKVFKTFESTKSALSELTQKDIIIDQFNIFSHLDFGGINGAKVVRLFCGQEPTPSLEFYKISQYQMKFTSLYSNLRKNPLRGITRIKKFFSLKKPFPYDFQILGGTEAGKHIKNSFYNDSFPNIRAHSYDYDRYLEEELKDENSGNIPKVPYAVFLDQNWFGHPDKYFSGASEKLLLRRPEKFLLEINDFFSKFSSQSGLNICIAAHPRSKYNTQNNLFVGHTNIIGETISLVRGAQVVLAQKSISLSFAVLYHKPVILLDSDYITQFFRNYLDILETELGAKRINITNTQSIALKDVTVDKIKYRQYKEKYIKEPGTPEKFCWDIVCDYLD